MLQSDAGILSHPSSLYVYTMMSMVYNAVLGENALFKVVNYSSKLFMSFATALIASGDIYNGTVYNMMSNTITVSGWASSFGSNKLER